MGPAAGKLNIPAATRYVPEQEHGRGNQASKARKAKERKGKNNMKIGYINCRGYKGKVADVGDIIEGEKIDIVALVETHIRKEEEGMMPSPEGYELICKGRENGQKKGGGVGFLVRKGVKWHIIRHDSWDNDSVVRNEMQWIGIETNGNKVAIGVVYVGHEGLPDEWNDQVYDRMRMITSHVQQQGYKVIIAGDFNGHIGDGMEGIEGGDREINRNGTRLINFTREYKLRIVNRDVQCKGKWTWTSGERRTIIDYVLVDSDIFQMAQNCEIDEDGRLDIGSDHNWITLELNIQFRKRERGGGSKWVWNIHKESDWEGYQESLRTELQEWKNKWEVEGEVQGMNEDLTRRILKVAQEKIGRKKVPTENIGYRVDPELKGAIRKRRVKNRAWRLARKQKQPQNTIEEAKQQYLECRKQVADMKAERRANKNEQLTEKIMKSGGEGSNIFWKFVNQKKRNKTHEIMHRGRKTEKKEDIQEALKEHWEKINDPRWGQGTVPNSQQEYRQDQWDPELCSRIREVEVQIAIEKMRLGKAPGSDNVLTEFIKKGPEEMVGCLQILFNRVLEKKQVPREWNKLRISYIPKKGSSAQLDQCRGIAIASNVGKIFSRVMYSRLSRIVERLGLLGEIQNGFRPGRRVGDHVFTLTQSLELARQRRKKIFMGFLDVRKAYDKVWREALWEKLQGLGFGGNFLQVLKAMYRDVDCTIAMGNIEVENKKLDIGLKQGCVLSPILFALYIKELGDQLTECGKGMIVGQHKIPGLFFADDIVLMAESQKEMQDLLDITGAYGNKWRLEFSKEKSKVMTLGRKPDINKKWKIGKFQIPEGQEQLIEIGEADEYEYLGIRIKATGKGMFRYHMEKIKQKVNRTKGMIKATSLNSFNRAFTARVLWDRVAIPGMMYGLDVISVSEGDIQNMEKAQNEMGRWILGAPPCTATEAVLGELGWNTVTDRIAKAKLNYWGYLQTISDDRWCRKIYMEAVKAQTKWVQNKAKLAEIYDLKGLDEVDDWKSYNKRTVAD